MTTDRLWLDPQGDAPVPLDRLVVDDEVQLVDVWGGDQPLLIRGEHLCRWIRAIAVNRGLDPIEVAHPHHELRRAAPSLTSEDALAIIDRLGVTA